MAEKNVTPMVDPIAYRPDYNAMLGSGVQLQNADMNLSQYGDDSSAANYNNPNLVGGQNSKYTGETTKNSQVAYDPNMTLETLDPNYKYGAEAQIANSQQANYIAMRNDNIASALYNAGLLTEQDVGNFLNTQEGFYNSNEAERQNTISSIYKRLGDLQKQQETPEEVAPKNENVEQDMQKDLQEKTGKIYGKITPDEGKPTRGIETQGAGRNINAELTQNRINKVIALQNMGPENIAMSVYNGNTPYGEQAMRDYKMYDKEGYAAYEKELKKLYTQDKVDNLSHGAAPDEEEKKFTDSVDETITNDIKNFERDNTGPDSKEGASYILNIKLESDEAAQTAKQEMLNIKSDIADIEDQIENLPNLARKAFKGDVPDYIYQAFISNNQQRLQRQLNKLESRYNAAAEIYKTEVAEKQREAEYELKQAEYNRALTNDAYDREYKNNKLLQDSITVINGIPYMIDPTTGNMIEIDDVTALNNYQSKVGVQSQWGQSLVGQKTGLECEGYTDKQAQATAGVTMVGSTGQATTNRQEKVSYATGGGFIGYYDENGNPVWDINGEIHYGNADVYDLIPQVGDIAVGVGGPYNTTWGHTMYIDKVRTDKNGEINFHYTATNKSSNPDEYTVGYEGTKTLKDFMANGGVGFWNPFKQAQYNGRNNTSGIYYSPMQDIIDAKMKNASISQLANLGTFQEIYTEMYQGIDDGQLDALIEQGAVGSFLQQLAVYYNTRSGGSTSGGANKIKDSSLGGLFALTVQQLGVELENFIAENAGEYSEEAYAGFLKVLRAVEIKLRDESGAAINESERATNFLQYLPKASDSAKMKAQKMKDLEEYIRRLGTSAGINSKEYVPLFTNLGQREI